MMVACFADHCTAPIATGVIRKKGEAWLICLQKVKIFQGYGCFSGYIRKMDIRGMGGLGYRLNLNKKMAINRFLIVVILIGLFLSSNSQTGTFESKKQEAKIEFEIFSEVPSEIDGCACFFSNNEQDYELKKYIFMNDFAKYAFIKINGKIEKFELIDNSESQTENSFYIYRKDQFILRIDIKKYVLDGDESSKLFGQIVLTNSTGLKTVIKFFGICGC